MQRIQTPERPDWQAAAEAEGFVFHTMYGEPYWDETSYYQFTLKQIEGDIEDPSTELHRMCLDAVDVIVKSDELMHRLAIPEKMRDYVASSWYRGDPELYGRFDLAYDGTGPAKLLEYNADTPTSLYEAATFQWKWLEDKIQLNQLRGDADQFNRIFEALSERFEALFPKGTDIHFASIGGVDNIEDYGTVETLGYAARSAGMGAHYTEMESIALGTTGQFADSKDRVIGTLFKLYPWEDMLRDDYAVHLANSRCQFIEPAWKAVVSNKGILPVLWRLFEGHPNLLPAFFADEMHSNNPRYLRSEQQMNSYVRKPVFSREGASVTIVDQGSVLEASDNTEYDHHNMIFQQYQPLPVFDRYRPIVGSWVIGNACVGMGIREDQSRITQNLSRFKPHAIIG